MWNHGLWIVPIVLMVARTAAGQDLGKPIDSPIGPLSPESNVNIGILFLIALMKGIEWIGDVLKLRASRAEADAIGKAERENAALSSKLSALEGDLKELRCRFDEEHMARQLADRMVEYYRDRCDQSAVDMALLSAKMPKEEGR